MFGGESGGAVIRPVTLGSAPGFGRNAGRDAPFTPCVVEMESRRAGGRSGGATSEALPDSLGGRTAGGAPGLACGGTSGFGSTAGEAGAGEAEGAGAGAGGLSSDSPGVCAAGPDNSPSRMGGICWAPDFFGVAVGTLAAGGVEAGAGSVAGVARDKPVIELSRGTAVFGGRRT